MTRVLPLSSPDATITALAKVGYLADPATATTTYLAGALGKPLLIEGPAGVGKTELAKAVASATDADLIRLQCYEGLDEARALYEWNYSKQLLRIQAAREAEAWDATHDDIFSEDFLLTRPLLTAIRNERPTVLLIDEVDKTDIEVEALLLEVLSDFQVTIPELGTIVATRRPFVVLTSNAARELSEALKRRCLFLHLDYPDPAREREIVTSRVPEIDAEVAHHLVETVVRLRELELKKAPSIAESIDWARTLVALEIRELDQAAISATLGAVLKHATDIDRATKELRLGVAMNAASGLVDRHLAFVTALRGAGLPVSLAEGIDALGMLGALDWLDREQVRAGYAATLVKKASWRATFDTLFDLYFPPLIGDGFEAGDRAPTDGADGAETHPAEASDADVGDFQDRLLNAIAAELDGSSDGTEAEVPSPESIARLAAEAVGRFGAMPGRAPGQMAYSAYQTLRRLAPADLTDALVQRLVAGLLGDTDDDPMAQREHLQRRAGRSLERFTRLVEDDARRRIAERKSPQYVSDVAVRPSIDRVAFLSARREEIEEMRRQIGPLARRLATRLARERAGNGRGALDFRRTVRASLSTGGVPIRTRHKPKHPHRTDLVVLCDVSGSVAHFAQFTLLLTYTLREHFSRLRAFTFVDRVHEVTDVLRPGRDPVEVMEELAAGVRQSALMGRTSYGAALAAFRRTYADALTPTSSLLILGDARSNFSDLALSDLRAMNDGIRAAWWLNPEHRRQWDTGDSAASKYASVVPMVECRNLVQLEEFVTRVL